MVNWYLKYSISRGFYLSDMAPIQTSSYTLDSTSIDGNDFVAVFKLKSGIEASSVSIISVDLWSAYTVIADSDDFMGGISTANATI